MIEDIGIYACFAVPFASIIKTESVRKLKIGHKQMSVDD